MCKHENRETFKCWSGHFGPTDDAGNLCVCNDCGRVFLERYHSDATYGEASCDRIDPGRTVGGVTFHRPIAELAHRILHITDQHQLVQLQGQLIGLAELNKKRRERLKEVEKELTDCPL